jgi:hypothetical protein
MTIDELIEELQEVRKEYGNLEVDALDTFAELPDSIMLEVLDDGRLMIFHNV